MANHPESVSKEPAIFPRGFLLTRLTLQVLLGLLAVALLFGLYQVMNIWQGWQGRWGRVLPYIIFGLAVLLPYAEALRGLRKGPTKDDQAYCIGLGTFVLLSLPFTAFVFVFIEGVGRLFGGKLFVGLILVGLANILVIAGSVVTLHHLGREKGDWRLLGKGVAKAAVVFVIFIFALVFAPPSSLFPEKNDAATVGSARLVANCAVHYRDTHPDRGFPTSLAELGPRSLGGIDCIDSVLAGGKKSEYLITYSPEPENNLGIREGYEGRAIPSECGRTGIRTYFWDETGIIRFTNDSAAGCPPADAQSPPL